MGGTAQLRRAAAEAIVEGTARYWAAERPVREARRTAIRAVAAAEIGELSYRELLIAGAIAYWCEGTKEKVHRAKRPRDRFADSHAGLIQFSPAIPRLDRDYPRRPDIPRLSPREGRH